MKKIFSFWLLHRIIKIFSKLLCSYFLLKKWTLLSELQTPKVSLRVKCLYSEFFWSVFSRIHTVCCMVLTHIVPLVSFHLPWKHLRTKNFLMFSRGIQPATWNMLKIKCWSSFFRARLCFLEAAVIRLEKEFLRKLFLPKTCWEYNQIINKYSSEMLLKNEFKKTFLII